jgi:hypothetical protein
MVDTTNSPQECTGIYADIQNLQEISRVVLLSLIRRWPDRMPPPGKLNLYVRADHVHLWGVWATDAFPSVEVTVKGVQHYSLAATKNAADMAIAVDAISDFNHKRVSHVAVISDDSDFISLYAKLAEEVSVEPHDESPTGHRVPFLWVLTDRIDTKSNLLQEFFPQKYVHIVDRFAPIPDDTPKQEDAIAEPQDSDPEPDQEPSSGSTDEPPPNIRAHRDMTVTERIALQLIRDMPVGKFKSTDCQQTIRTNFPGHSLSAADGPTFGIIFRRDVLPFMEKRGVKELGDRRPRQYEMTHEAKRSLARF